MPLIYFDCFSGVAGDMIIGALLDAGLPFDDFRAELAKLDLSVYEISSEKVTRGGIAGTKFSVEVKSPQPSRHLSEITALIQESTLDNAVKDQALAIFTRLGEAEAAVHNEPLKKVHFHEVGAVDAIIDICGAVIGLGMLGIDKVYSSSLPLGRGSVNTSHGQMPVPAPATSELVKGFPVRITDNAWELTTPTGAAILTTLATFADPGEFALRNAGYGAGTKALEGLPNLLRVMIGEPVTAFETDTVVVLETNLDRVTPENLGSLIDDLMAAGALEAFVVPVVMKKGRPGHLLSVLCEPDKKDKLAGVVFASGRTLGIRQSQSSRIKLPRKEVSVTTSGGDVSVKIAEFAGKRLIFPEHDDMRHAMKVSGRNYDDIYFEIERVLRKD